jgi:hypothetical protein
VQPIPEYLVFKNVYSYLKSYPEFDRLITYDQPRKVRVAGYEPRFSETSQARALHAIPKTLRELESLRRAKTKISDLVICNDFTLFCTFTFKKDRDNITACKERMSKWLNNTQYRYGKFQYLIVPEFHSDGVSIHFHALISGNNIPLRYSGIQQRNRRVYNITNYKNGHTTVTKITDKQKVSSYLKKYITKEMPQLPGKKRYWVSSNLIRPTKTENPQVSISDYKHLFTANGMSVYHSDTKKTGNPLGSPALKTT